MTDRDLIKKLSNLREIKPDSNWLKANRDSLYTQISNSGVNEPSVWTSFIITFKNVMKTALNPAMALASIMVVLLGTSAYGHLLLSQAKPNQSLYIAREISEKAKLNTILNTEEREQMAGKFAANNAQDIINVLSDPETKDEAEIAKLSSKFNEEIKTVQKTVAKAEQPAVQKVDTLANNGADEVFSASTEKDSTGLSVNAEVLSESTTTVSTTTKIIEEAQNLFNEKKYKEAGELLNSLVK